MANRKKTTTPGGRKNGGHRTTPADDPNCYRVTVSGPLKIALEKAFGDMQDSRKYRRLASSSIHELAKEALDRGLSQIESDIEEEQQERV